MSLSKDTAARVSAAERSPFVLEDVNAYRAWRDRKLAAFPTSVQELVVPVVDGARLGDEEYAALLDRCRRANMAIYQLADPASGDREMVRALGARFGLHRLDDNLGADEDSITALRVVEGDRRTGYIPYTNRRLNWHADGYYNPLDKQIRGVVMHCASAAAEGGANALIDQEIIYIQLRDENPDYIRALMHPEVMTIPPNREGGEQIRGAQTGPVFSLDLASGSLHMRYTARKRSIEWRDDALTREAVGFLESLLEGSPYRFEHRLATGQGILCNNVLHCRTAFENSDQTGQQRLLYRARYYDRIAGTGIQDTNG